MMVPGATATYAQPSRLLYERIQPCAPTERPSVRLIKIRAAVQAFPLLFAATIIARAGTITDNFNAAQNYLGNGTANTIWDGVYTGAGNFSGGNVGTVAGTTVKADADITGAGWLSVQSVQTGWENKEDDGFFLFKNVTGDFSVSVHVISPYDPTAYNTAGLMARAAGAGGAPYGGKENYVSWTRFDEFNFANYLRSTVNNVTAQINPGDYPNTNYWLRMDRVNDTNFVFYEKARQSDPWQVVTFPSPVNGTNLVRADLAGVPLQVGISHAAFSGIIVGAQFEQFSLSGTNVGNGPVTFVTQPQSQTVTQGRTAAFVANLTGTAPVSLQWFRNGSPLAGQTNPIFSFPVAVADNSAVFQLLATNVVAGVTNMAASSNATLTVISDSVLPVLLSAQGSVSNGVSAVFSEPISAATATNPANYLLTGPNGSVTISAATPDTTGAIIALSTPPLLAGSNYTLAVTGLSDLAGNIIEPGNQVLFQASGLAGTLYDGLYTGAGAFPGGNSGPAPGSTLVANANLTGTNQLTVESTQTDWENYDDGFFLFKNVTGDFSVSVHVVSPFDNTAYNTAGLMIRAAGPGGSPYNGAEDWISWTRFDESGFANYLRVVVNNTLMQINPGDAPNSNYWLRIDRVNGTQFNFYEKAQESDPWKLVNFGPNYLDASPLSRSDLAGVPLQVGIIQCTFSATPLQAQFENFSLSGTNVGNGAVVFASQPQSQTVPVGQPATFTADARGLPLISLQWLRNGQPMANQTNFTLTVNTTAADNNANYQLLASNVISGVTYIAASSNALLTLSGDLNAPTLVDVRSSSINGVILQYSETVSAATATNPGNYTLTGPGGAVSLGGGVIDPSSTSVTFTTPPLLAGSNYAITISNVTDTVGTPIAPGTQATFIATPYTLVDIGSPAITGAFGSSNGQVSLSGGGAGIGGTADQFSFGYQTYTGNFDVQIRLGSLGLSDLWASAGLMARDGLASNSIFAAAMSTPGPSGSFFQYRSSVGGTAAVAGTFPVNYPDTWLRLQRVGNVFTGYASLDGLSWTQLGTVTMAADATLQVGIAISSHNASEATTTVFDSDGNTQSAALSASPLPFEPLGPTSRHTGLVFSEIMYHPTGVFPGSLEFVEIYNSDIVYEDMSGYQLAGSINYTFPKGTILPAGGYLVVAADPASLQAYYGISGVLGPYTNKLPNSSGTLQLLNDLNSVLLEVDYDTVAPWPIAADGGGHSLVLRKPSYGENDPRAWGISDVVDGSPGRGDGWGTEPLRPVVINEFLANSQSPSQDAIELFNTGNTPLNIGGCYLSDDPTTNKYLIPSNTMIPARGFVSFSQSQFGFTPAPGGGSLYLKNPSLTRVLDCVRYQPQQEGVSFGRYPDGNDQWYRLSSPTFGAANAGPLLSQIVINELMYKPISGLDDDQYVELYNRGSNTVSLGGWSFTSGITFTFPTNAVIGSNGYIVVAANMARMLVNYTNLNPGNTFGNFSGHLSHHGERVALAMPETQVTTNGSGTAATNVVAVDVDEVTYGTGGRWGEWADGGGSSLELTDPNSNKRFAANWADSDETAKAPWTTIQRTDIIDLGQGTTGDAAPNRFEMILQDAGEFLLDDVQALNNGGTNFIRNPGFESGTNGWYFTGTFETTGLETNLPAFDGNASLHVRASGGGDTGANRIAYDMGTMTVGGTNQATLLAHVRWLKGNTNVLMRIRGNWLECAAGLTAPTNCGTPGMPNSRLVANAGPAISSVGHYPILPAANQPVVVSARLDDPNGISQATLFYRLDPSRTYTAVAMHDDGTGGDAEAGDGIWSATIPGQASNTMVAFTIQASDGRPIPGSTVFPANAPATECMVNFGETLATANIGSYRMWLTQSNISYWNARAKNSDEGIDCTMVYGNWRVIYNAQTEYTGSPFHTPSYNGPLGSFACNYLMFFPDDDLLMGNDKFLVEAQGPTDQNTFNNDASAVGETTAHWLAHKLGIRPDNRRYVLVYMNGQQRGMIYWDYQKPDSDVVSEFYPNDDGGNLHKIDDWFEFDDAGSGQSDITAKLIEYNLNGQKRTERYRWSWEPVGGSPPNDFTNFFTLVDAANAPGPQPYINTMLSLVDMRQFMRMWALEHFVGDWDSYGYRRGKNMYLYKPTTGPWQFLIYDIQLDFGKSSDPTNQPIFDQGNTNDPTLGDPLVTRMYNTPVFVREYWEALDELTTNLMLPQVYGPLMDARTAALRADGVPVESATSIKNWIAGRVAFVAPQIPQASFTLNGPNPVSSSSNSVTITGTAPIGVENISVNGANYPINWTGVTTWSITVPLAPGANSLSLTALDINGDPIPNGGANLTANFTGAGVSPAGRIVINEIMHHPALDGAQYVELYNTQSNTTFDLSNWRIDALGYVFPPGSSIAPQGYLVLAQNRYEFPIAYGVTGASVFDQFPGAIDPNSETLALVQPGVSNGPDLTVAETHYDAGAPWPAGATQPGSSLQLIDPLQDNWRAGNWAAVVTNAPPPAPQWVQAVATGTASSSLLYIYLQSAGDVYVDDIQLVAGSVAGAGSNLLTDGDFESGFPGAVWNVSTNLTGSSLSTAIKHSGNASLHVVSTSAGTTQSSAIYQTMTPALTTNATYTLSYWYLQSTNGGPLTIRLSGSGIVDTVSPAPPTNGVVLTATPGASNSVLASLPPFPSLWINELQASNVTGIQNSAGQRTPWIELYNPSSNAVALSNLYLANNYSNLTQWAFPSNAVIGAGQFKVVFADGLTNLSTTNEPHTSFVLTSPSGGVALSRLYSGQPQVLDYVNYSALPPNDSYGSLPDGQSFLRQVFFAATPGGANNGIGQNPHSFIAYGPAGAVYAQSFDSLPDPGAASVNTGNPVTINGVTYSLGNPFDFAYPVLPSGNIGGLGDSALAGWYGMADPTASVGSRFGATDGDQTTGGILSFGSPNSSNRSLGLLATSTTGYTGFGAEFINETGSTLNCITVQLTGEVWRQSNLPKLLQCYYLLDPTATNLLSTNATAGLPALNVSFPTVAGDSGGVAVNGSLPANQSSLGVTNLAIINWPPGAALWLVWEMADPTGKAQGLGIDNLSFSATTVQAVASQSFGVQVSGGNAVLGWQAPAGPRYQVEFKNNLTDPAWTLLGSPIPGTGGLITVTNSLNPSSSCFFRLVIQQ
jgi:regulation of enolase protein 1 (concanavalin A-like superfamily)